MVTYAQQPISSWALEDRPREKLMQRGIDALTNAELLAILLGSGTRALSAIDLARKVMDTCGGPEGLARSTVQDLVKLKGIGPAKAITIVAAFEISRRQRLIERKIHRVTESQGVANYLMPRMSDLDHEIFHVLFLNRNNEIISEETMFKGGAASTIIDPKIIYKAALRHMACGLIVAHNHPSGSLTPSRADQQITKVLVEAGNIFDMPLLDHLIISSRGYYSFADEGRM